MGSMQVKHIPLLFRSAADKLRGWNIFFLRERRLVLQAFRRVRRVRPLQEYTYLMPSRAVLGLREGWLDM